MKDMLDAKLEKLTPDEKKTAEAKIKEVQDGAEGK